MPSEPTVRVLITRPTSQAEPWVRALQQAGIDAHALPLIDIAPVSDVSNLVRAWRRLPELTAVMFVSANAVEAFMAAKPPDVAGPPSGVLACSTGSGTTRALIQAGWSPEDCIQPAPDASVDSEGLWDRLSAIDWVGRRVLIVRGQEGRSWLMQQWQQAGAQVDVVVAYERRLPSWTEAEQELARQAVADPAGTLWSLTSSEAVRHLGQLMPAEASLWTASQAVVTHPRIAEAARDIGFGVVQILSPDIASQIEHVRRRRPAISDGSLESPQP